ncbi:hypothetical protein HDZ31DRAFT_66839 [Schizophyllum fasciatum]
MPHASRKSFASADSVAQGPPSHGGRAGYAQQSSKKLFGTTRARGQARAVNPYDYEQKYEEDVYGEELGSNARFWHVLLDEGRVYDMELIEGWRDTLDVLLVFAGLFSAVVTTFVVQSSQALQPDYAQVAASLMAEMLAIQRAWATGLAVDDVPRSSLTLDSVSASSLDYWCNGLWFSSLALSMSAALMAVLVKQWLLAFSSHVSGTPKHQALARQFRLIGVERWNVPLIVGLLPMLLHVSLLLFFVGLSLYIFTFDAAIAWVIITLSILVYSLYLAANVLPMIYSQCPYKSPLSHYGYIILRYFVDHTCARWVRQLTSEGLPSSSFARSTAPRSRFRRWISRARTAVSSSVTPLARLLSHSTASTPRAREALAVARTETSLLIDCLTWVHATSSNPSAISITVQALSGLPDDVAERSLVHDEIFREVLTRLEALDRAEDGGKSSTRERLLRSLLFLTVPDSEDVRYFMLARHNFLIIYHREDPPELQGAVLAHATDPLDLPLITAAPPNHTLPLPFTHVSTPEALRLQPIIWRRILPYLAQSVDRSRTHALHLAIYVWQHLDARANSTADASARNLTNDMPLWDASPQDLQAVFMEAIYNLLGGMHYEKTFELKTVRDMSLHMLCSALEGLVHAAGEQDEVQMEGQLELHHRELKFLRSIAMGLSLDLSDAQAQKLVNTLAKVARVSNWSAESRAELLDCFAVIPFSMAQSLLCSVAHLMMHSQGVEIWQTIRMFRLMADIYGSRPDEALDATLEDDTLAVLWPHLEAVMEANWEQPDWSRYDRFAQILVPYFAYIVTVLPDEDVARHMDYLTRQYAHVDSETTPANHLARCLAVDVLTAVEPTEETRSLHSDLAQLASRTSSTHVKEWADALASFSTQWRIKTPAVRDALRTEGARRRLHDLAEAISPGLDNSGVILPVWETDIEVVQVDTEESAVG